MKLRNKLIPLLSVVATTGVVAPIATSCGYSTTEMDMVDISKNYVPTIDKAKKVTTETSDVDAQDLYFEHLAENPEILAQDIYKYEADYLPTRIEYIEYYDHPNHDVQDYIAKNVTAKVGVSNITFKKVNYVDKEGSKTVEKSFYAISCNLQYKFTFTALSVDGKTQLDANLNMSASLKDVPTIVYSVNKFNPHPGSIITPTITKCWRVTNQFTDSKLLDAVPGWSYTFNRDDVVTFTKVDEYGQKHVETNDYVKNGIINRQDQIADLLKENNAQGYYDDFLSFDSYHLSDVTAWNEPLGFNLNLTNDNIETTINAGPDSDEKPVWTLNGFTIFNNVDSELASILASEDYKANLYFGIDDTQIPQTAAELMDQTDAFIKTADPEEHVIKYQQGSDEVEKTPYLNSPSILFNGEFNDFEIDQTDPQNIKITVNGDTDNKFNIKQLDDIGENIHDIESWAEGTEFKSFYALPAGSYIGYAYVKLDDNGDPIDDTFVCKTAQIDQKYQKNGVLFHIGLDE